MNKQPHKQKLNLLEELKVMNDIVKSISPMGEQDFTVRNLLMSAMHVRNLLASAAFDERVNRMMEAGLIQKQEPTVQGNANQPPTQMNMVDFKENTVVPLNPEPEVKKSTFTAE